VLCGLTGVGKTSALAALRPMIGGFVDLPERRALFDDVIARRYRSGPAPVDRIERFALASRFRTEHPGGMAVVLSHLAVRPEPVAAPLVFDGLRGEDEIRHAATALPRACFAALLAPDFVRLLRLLRRADAFDQVGVSSSDRCLPPGLGELFDPSEVAELDRRVAAGTLTTAELATRLAIVREERLHYDPDRMVAALAGIEPRRRLTIDTVRYDPPAVAALIADFLRMTLRPA
jgi:hypothetical protein